MATLFIYLSVCLFVHSSICLFIYLIILQLKTVVYHSDRQALFTAQFRRAGLLATANNCYINYFVTAGRNDIVFVIFVVVTGSLGSRVVSMQDSGAVYRAWFQIAAATLSGNSRRQTVHTHHASVHQAAKPVAALLWVVRVTAGLAESNDSLPPGLWLKSPAGWLPRTGISSVTLRLVIEYGLPLPFTT